MENANLVCPLCRIRIGSWLRSSKKENKLINMDYWNAIKRLFPVQIKNKLEGIEENIAFETPSVRLAEPGELKREYETEMQKESEVIRLEREAEAKASEDLIKKIREEEEYKKIVEEEKLRLDEEVAKKLADELNSTEKNWESKETECSQSTSQMKNHSSNVPNVGPLDRFFKYKQLKDINKPSTDIQNKKIDFSKKEYTCRILCQDISDEWDYVGWKSNINSRNMNVISKKSSAEVNALLEAEGNSDSSDSIDSEYRYFKPIDYRRNPPCQKSIPIKVPTVKAEVIQLEVSAPKGPIILRINSGNSAFAPFISPILQKKETETSKTAKRKCLSPEKRHIPASIRDASPDKGSTDSLSLKKVIPGKKKISSICVENLDIPISTGKKEHLIRTKSEKINSPSKRKGSNSDSSPEYSKKKLKSESNDNISRHLLTPSSPFRGFETTDSSKEFALKTSPRNSRSKAQQNKSPQKNSFNAEKEKIEIQVRADYELARKLQNQYNSVSYSTRSSVPRKSIKVTRQTTLDNILSKKSYKV
ncbi:hypothetical protein WA026_010575 [Henosepilachna vigintioctopunctata]|uniref:RING-type E3 ubiquitin transferase n=1 Tax=Henosepilachna vigintioctopunctata TaxID=420089 RepID=A0AAW1V5F9_9CUCU